MEAIKNWIFPTTCLAEAVKIRPASLAFLYRLGCNPWAQSGMTLEKLGILSGLTTEQIMRELECLPIPERDTHWEEQPVCFLIDYLTAQHREFIYSDLPAFKTLLEMPPGRISGSDLYRLLREAFLHFNIEFQEHMQEEENHFFPGILRNEYALRHGGGGLVRPIAEDFLASERLIDSKDQISLALDQWMQCAEIGDRFRAGTGRSDIALEAMRELDWKIRTHEGLEQERLYPMAARIESELAANVVH